MEFRDYAFFGAGMLLACIDIFYALWVMIEGLWGSWFGYSAILVFHLFFYFVALSYAQKLSIKVSEWRMKK